MLTLQEDQILTIPNLMPAALPLWVALVVRSRHEKSVQTILDAKGYRTSVPLVRCFLKRSSGSAWDSQHGLIVEAEIEALERIAASGLPVVSCGYTRIGETVELIAGPLQGVRGIVLRQGKSTRLVVGVELLQRSVSVEVDGAWAVPIRIPPVREGKERAFQASG